MEFRNQIEVLEKEKIILKKDIEELKKIIIYDDFENDTQYFHISSNLNSSVDLDTYKFLVLEYTKTIKKLHIEFFNQVLLIDSKKNIDLPNGETLVYETNHRSTNKIISSVSSSIHYHKKLLKYLTCRMNSLINDNNEYNLDMINRKIYNLDKKWADNLEQGKSLAYAMLYDFLPLVLVKIIFEY